MEKQLIAVLAQVLSEPILFFERSSTVNEFEQTLTPQQRELFEIIKSSIAESITVRVEDCLQLPPETRKLIVAKAVGIVIDAP